MPSAHRRLTQTILAAALLVSAPKAALAQCTGGQIVTCQRGNLPLNGATNGTLTERVYDFYSVHAPADGTLSIQLGSQPDGSCTKLISIDGTLLSSRSDVPLAKGDYNLVGVTYAGGYYGASASYNITTSFREPTLANDIEPNDTIATAQSLVIGQIVTGHLGYFSNYSTSPGHPYLDTIDTFRIDLLSDETVTLGVRSAEDALKLTLTVLDATGANVAGGGSGGTSGTVTTNLARGTYYLRLDNARGAGGTGSYELTTSGTITGSCTNCLTVSGHARIRGSAVAIKGNGSPARAVRLYDSGLQPTSYFAPLAADGSYIVTAPAGTYTAVCDVSYTDKIELPGGGFSTKLRHALQTLPLLATSGLQLADFALPPPIVFIHGISSGPEKWDDWSSILGADQSGPSGVRDAVFFTPTYTDHYSDRVSYPDESASIASQLQADFSIFTETPPYDVVAHSKGGLVARVFHGSAPAGAQMQHVVLLGTPNDGSNCLSGTGAERYDLSRCDLETLNGQTPGWASVRVLAVAGSKHALPLACGASLLACKFENGPDDGMVPIDSVFKITSTNSGTPKAQMLPGFVVPYNHCELGSRESSWLFSSIILPFFKDGSIGVNNRPLACPPNYGTSGVSCSTDRPSPSDYWYEGRGLTSDGECTLTPRTRGAYSATVAWTAPAGGGGIGAPGSPTAVPGSAAGCDKGVGGLVVGNASDPSSPTGYQIYRASRPMATLDPNLRIGYVPATQLCFADPSPLVGVNFYAVTAVYANSNSESSLAPAAPLSFSIRRHAASH